MSRPSLEDTVEYLAAVVFLKTIRLLPARALPGLSRVLGTLIFDVLGYRRKVALSNLERHLGSNGPRNGLESGAGNCRSLGRQAVQSFVMGLMELGRLPLVDRAHIEKHITIEGLDRLDEALKRGTGAVLVTGHLGSWEVAGYVLAKMGYPVDMIVGVQRNRFVQEMINNLRRSGGVGIIEPGRLLGAVRSLKANRLVAMLSDQDAGRKGVFVDFLGEQASTPRLAAHLSILAKSPIIPGFIVSVAGCRHRIVIESAIDPPGALSDQAVKGLTQAYTRVIESYVRRHPGQWLWTHRRWKTRPG